MLAVSVVRDFVVDMIHCGVSLDAIARFLVDYVDCSRVGGGDEDAQQSVVQAVVIPGEVVVPEVETAVPDAVSEPSCDAGLEKRRARRQRQRANRKAAKLAVQQVKAESSASYARVQLERLDLERQRTAAYVESVNAKLVMEKERTEVLNRAREATAARTYAQVAKIGNVTVVSTTSTGSQRRVLTRSVSPESAASYETLEPRDSVSQKGSTDVAAMMLPEGSVVMKKLEFWELGRDVAKYIHGTVDGWVVPIDQHVHGCQAIRTPWADAYDGEVNFVPGEYVECDNTTYMDKLRSSSFTQEYHMSHTRPAWCDI